MAEKPPRGLYGQRPSKSADAARREQFARDWAMTPVERMLVALRLGERDQFFLALRASEKSKP